MEEGGSATGWYARRDGVIRGPFSAADVSRYILLGRIRLDDEISRDRQGWQSVTAVAELLPPELQQMSNWEDYQQLVIARMQADERRQDRRATTRSAGSGRTGERRAGSDRRTEEAGLSLARYFFAASESIRQPRVRNYRLGTLLLTVALAVLVVAWLLPLGGL